MQLFKSTILIKDLQYNSINLPSIDYSLVLYLHIKTTDRELLHMSVEIIVIV